MSLKSLLITLFVGVLILFANAVFAQNEGLMHSQNEQKITCNETLQSNNIINLEEVESRFFHKSFNKLDEYGFKMNDFENHHIYVESLGDMKFHSVVVEMTENHIISMMTLDDGNSGFDFFMGIQLQNESENPPSVYKISYYNSIYGELFSGEFKNDELIESKSLNKEEFLDFYSEYYAGDFENVSYGSFKDADFSYMLFGTLDCMENALSEAPWSLQAVCAGGCGSCFTAGFLPGCAACAGCLGGAALRCISDQPEEAIDTEIQM